MTSAHVLHRWVAVVVGLIVLAVAVVAWRTERERTRPSSGSPWAAAGLYAVQVAHRRRPGADRSSRRWTQTLHLALGAVIWALMAGLTVTSYYTARVGAPAPSTGVRARADDAESGAATHGATRSARTSR